MDSISRDESSPRRLGNAGMSASIGVAGLLALFFSFPLRPVGFPLDDAWIHLVYARSLADDFVLGYVPGLPGSGCTSPAWAVMLAVVHKLAGPFGIDAIVWGARLLGALFFVGSVVVSAWLVERRTGRREAAIFAAALVSICSGLAMAAFSGMEVTACAFAIVAAVAACERERFDLAGVAMALACALRPEAVLAMVVLGLLELSSRRSSPDLRRIAGWMAGPSILVGTLLVAHNLRASGHPLPATFYLKGSFDPSRLVDRVVQVFVDVFGGTAPFVGHFGWLGIVGLFDERSSRKDRSALVIGLLFVLAACAVTDPKHAMGFYFNRYFYPALPMFIVATVVGGHRLFDRLQGRMRIVAPVAVGIALLPGLWIATKSHSFHLHNDTRNIDEVQVRMGRELGRITDPRARIATIDAGAVRYFSNRETVDLMGLNNLEIREDPARYLAEHPVTHIASMAVVTRLSEDAPVRIVGTYDTENYSVISVDNQRQQVIAECTGRGIVRLGTSDRPLAQVLCDPAARR